VVLAGLWGCGGSPASAPVDAGPPDGGSACAAAPDGTDCGDDGVCQAGACQPGCFIDGQPRAPGWTDFDCHVCDPGRDRHRASAAWGTPPCASGCGTCSFGRCVPVDTSGGPC
jgi:hypothetical protein